MKKIISIVIMIFLVSVIYSQRRIQQLQDGLGFSLNGQVKSVVSSLYKLTDSLGVLKKNDLQKVIEYKFDQHGNVLEYNEIFSTTFNTHSVKAHYDWINYQVIIEKDEAKVLKFNDDWNLIEETTYGGDGKVLSKTINKFNDLGLIKEEIDIYKGELSSRTTYEYDKKGNLLEKKTLSDGGVSLRSFAYDKDNNRIKACFSSSILQESCSYTEYNEIGNPVFTRNSGQTKFKSYEYDKNNILRNVYHFDAIDTTETSSYNEKGQMIKNVKFIENVKYETTKKYNKRGDLVFLELDPPKIWEIGDCFSSPDIKYYDENTKIVFNSTYEFEYDELGNCTIDILYLNYLPVRIVERKFEYFD